MKIEELKQRIGAILDVDPAKIDDTTGAKTHPAWDSMASLEIISMLEEFTPGEIEEEEGAALKSFGEVVAFARRRGILED